MNISLTAKEKNQARSVSITNLERIRMERKSLSKKIRFEVFKRDKFTCQYCGDKAPDVILEVDHILPVAAGGGNEMLNLITACRDCNRGKGKTTLSDESAAAKKRRQAEELQERREQIEMMSEWHMSLIEQEKEMIEMIENIISECSDIEFSFNKNGEKWIKKQVRRFGLNEMIESIKIALDYYDDIEEALEKSGGIAYNRANRSD